jgi:hypothetical protein
VGIVRVSSLFGWQIEKQPMLSQAQFFRESSKLYH